MLPIALVSLSALVAPPHLAHATDGGAVLTSPVQWELIAACPRLKLGGDRGYASAVVVGQNESYLYLLTVDHAVKDVDEVEVQFYTRRSYPLPARTMRGATTEIYSSAADVVLLRVPLHDPRNDPYPPALKLVVHVLLRLPLVPDPIPVVRLPVPGQRPKRYPFPAVSVGCSTGGPPSCIAETIRGKRFARDEKSDDSPGVFVWEAGRAQQAGRSGGPLVSADRTVIGICRAKSTDRGYYTHLDEIHAVLIEKKFDWLWKSQDDPPQR